MRTRVLALRILSQLRHDRRTLAVVLFAPILVMSLLYFILNSPGATYTVIVGECPEEIVTSLESNKDTDINVITPSGGKWTEDCDVSDGKKLKKELKDSDAVAAITVSDDYDDVHVYVDGTNATDANKVKRAFADAFSDAVQEKQEDSLWGKLFDIHTPEIEYDYIYGEEDGSIFDSYGSALIGLIIFFFVFLISGINFLTERTSGTLEKMLSTPIKKSEIVLGYTVGYSILAMVQTVLITLFVVYILGMNVAGNIAYVILINILTAVCALTFGTLMSSMANSEFQMIQFIPIAVVPQVFLCGMFSLSHIWDVVGHCVPLYYSAHALQKVIMQGQGIGCIYKEIIALTGFSVLFMALNVLNLKKYRSW